MMRNTQPYISMLDLRGCWILHRNYPLRLQQHPQIPLYVPLGPTTLKFHAIRPQIQHRCSDSDVTLRIFRQDQPFRAPHTHHQSRPVIRDILGALLKTPMHTPEKLLHLSQLFLGRSKLSSQQAYRYLLRQLCTLRKYQVYVSIRHTRIHKQIRVRSVNAQLQPCRCTFKQLIQCIGTLSRPHWFRIGTQ